MDCIQTLDTSGARAVETFVVDGERYLVVPQLAVDVPGQPAAMTLGNSDIEALVFRWEQSAFTPCGTLPVPGGEDAEFFTLGGRKFLATASLRTGKDPYSLRTDSTIFEWSEGRWAPFQSMPTVAAKQWRHFRIGERDFLALAQGAAEADGGRDDERSCIFEWDGERFAFFQALPSAWGYNWCFFEVDGLPLLAHADHVVPSTLWRWKGERFEPFQELEGRAGRAFCFVEAGGERWLAFARLFSETLMLRWNGQRFEPAQVLSGPGGREFRWVPGWDGGRLVQVNFLQGSREAPITRLQSLVHKLEDGRWQVDQEFPTSGGTDAVAFEEDGGAIVLVVSESLAPEVRFRAPSRVYRIAKEERP
ncbi:hypothetical protein HHL11_16375 [Ramlibacter sp. G-1-2-2]|uniref:EPTP domain-containing protein n=1 Tax=Ramlibacter agri TaxID=2728837 RepID=A0A848H757_9BURK|nr:hypothetical protein [Ramlibacter agri]NML45331.1 hypothetical protein [Ramlibacter agri]